MDGGARLRGAGGDGAQQRRHARRAARGGSSAHSRAGDRVDEIHARARKRVAEGRGREALLMPGWWYAITAESFIDRLTEVPDTLALVPQVRCPVLAIRGEQENAERYPAEALARAATAPATAKVIAGSDHF